MEQKIATEKNPSSENRSLRKELKRAHRELAILYEVSNAMRNTLELDPILHTILTAVTAHTGLGFNRAILFLINQYDRCLEPRMAIGPGSGEHAQKIWEHITEKSDDFDDLIQAERITHNINESPLYESIKGLKIPLDKSEDNLLAQVYHRGMPIHITSDNISKHAQDPILQIFKTNELIIMPLKAKDKINGLILADNLFTQKSITNNDLRMFTMLSNQAGLAIENSQLYEMVKQKSHTDSLTGVWNHGFFQNQLERELNLAQKNSTEISLIMMDIDNFKKLNDTYGHHNGDIILKDIAKLLKDCSRDADYVCRYGGEEFAIILPQTNKEQGIGMAERIRETVERHYFASFSLYQKICITISVGLANYPDDASTKQNFVQLADKAMYKAKFGGKNQVAFP